MKHLVRTVGLSFVLLVLFIMTTIPTMAQYTKDELDHALCMRVTLNTSDLGGIGQHFEFLWHLDDPVPSFEIQYTDPNTLLEFSQIVTPDTFYQVASPSGGAFAILFDNGHYVWAYGGEATAILLPLHTGCLGAADDGRLNMYEQSMLAVIYPDGAEGYNIWLVNVTTNVGAFDYNISREAIDAGIAAANSSGTSQLLASGATSSFYVLVNGECQLNSPNANGDMQTFIFYCALNG